MKLKTAALSLTAGALMFAGAIGLQNAYAAEDGQYSTIVERIAETFNLNKDDVQNVFKQVEEERRAEMQARMEEKLNQAVEDGKMTEEEKQEALDHMKEMEQKHQELQAMTEEERKAHFEEMRENGEKPFRIHKFHHGMEKGEFEVAPAPMEGDEVFFKHEIMPAL